MNLISSWFLMLAAVCAGVLFSHMPISAVYQGSALLLVLGTQLIFLIFEYKKDFLGLVVRISRKAETDHDRSVVVRSILLGTFFSVFGYVLGVVQIMRNLNSVDAMGPAVALCIMSALYSIVTPILFIGVIPKDQVKFIVASLTAYVFLAVTATLALTLFALHTLK